MEYYWSTLMWRQECRKEWQKWSDQSIGTGEMHLKMSTLVKMKLKVLFLCYVCWQKFWCRLWNNTRLSAMCTWHCPIRDRRPHARYFSNIFWFKVTYSENCSVELVLSWNGWCIVSRWTVLEGYEWTFGGVIDCEGYKAAFRDVLVNDCYASSYLMLPVCIDDFV